MKFIAILMLFCVGCGVTVDPDFEVKECSQVTRNLEVNINGCWRIISLEHLEGKQCANVTKCEMFAGKPITITVNGLVSVGDVRCDAKCD